MGAIRIVDYDPSWPAIFAAECDELLTLLGGFADEIHHIGSTSVPGLAAKPKIDIDAILRRTDMLPEAIARVQENPYRLGACPKKLRFSNRELPLVR